MAMFEEAQSTTSRKTWRAVVIGAVVPLAMLAAAPAVSAAEIEQVEAAVEQAPPAPGPGAPDDPQGLLDLQQCLTDIQALLPAETPPAPAPGGTEQVPPGPAPGAPDLDALNELCQQVLASLGGQAPAPADDPVGAP
jgi:hypothetical protein